jgi:hypothetical protein
MRTLFEHSPAHVVVRRTLAAALLGGVALSGAVALAEEPVPVPAEAPPATVTTQTTTTIVATPQAAPALPPPPTVSAPVAPYTPPPAAAPMAPPPPPMAAPVPPPAPFAGSFQGPVYYNGPVWIVPAQPGQPAPVLPPQLPPPPVYVAPPVAAPLRLYQPRPLYRRYITPKPTPRGPVVGIGARFTALGLSNQEIFGQKLNMIGGGIQVRFRNQGHWGFELGMDALRASIDNNAFVRTSYPFTFAPMLYLRQNRPDTHFNIYAVAGFGLMADNITLYQDTSQERKQQFWEVMGQFGGGIEVRFTHLALFADVRAVGMLLDDSTQSGQYYQNVDGGPIAANSFGYKANLGAMLWF